MAQSPEPNATGSIEVRASPERVYELVSDPASLAEIANEYSGFRWLDGSNAPQVGARLKGNNKAGWRRWSTVSTITDAEPGKRFGFQVTVEAGPIAITGARWRYDIEPTDDGCAVTESSWDPRAGWAKALGDGATGVRDRAEHNRRNIAGTLRSLKARAEAATA